MKRIDIKQNKDFKKTTNWIKNRINKLEVYFLILLSISLFTMDRSHRAVIVNMRANILDRMVVVVEVVTAPAAYLTNTLNFFRKYKDLITENGKLKEQNSLLNRNMLLIRILRVENLKLRKLLDFLSSYSEIEYVTTRVVGSVSNNGFNQSAFIPLGSEDGIQNDQAIVNDKGLIGKTIDVGRHSSRILFITDKNFRIPVNTIESSTRAIVAGYNKGYLKLLHLPYQHKIQDKEIVVTAGNNQFFPPGIYIGYISEEDKVITDVNLQQIDFVSIMKPKNYLDE